MRVLFFGTPDIAVPTLRALCDSEHEVCGVVTQPDKRQGRKMELKFPAVKEFALSRELPVYQPERLKDGALNPILEKLRPDLLVVIAYGRILPDDVLNFAPYGAINLHASLLPKYRGAGPIQWAVINGERETGVTVMQMDSGLDTGDMLYTVSTPIGEEETAGELFERMAPLCAEALLAALPKIERRELTPKKQEESLASYAPMLSKEMAKLDFSDAERCHNQIRGMNPWPVAYTFYRGKKLKVFAARTGCTSSIAPDRQGYAIGTPEGISVRCGKGILLLTEVQLEGGKRMDASAFLMGHPMDCAEELR